MDTAVAPSQRRSEIVARIHRACAGGEQAYWVCTTIEESEALACRAAEDTARELAETLPDLRVGLVHGRMPPAEKDAAMAAFKEARTDVLVATTVIEVGVDVPNASLMIIENAERLGLAQLHQLRGRVGRGARRSACVMMYDGPLTGTARSRLEVLRATTDGFEIARRDLEIRGPGELLGTRQTGSPGFASPIWCGISRCFATSSGPRPIFWQGTSPASRRSSAAGSGRERTTAGPEP